MDALMNEPNFIIKKSHVFMALTPKTLMLDLVVM